MGFRVPIQEKCQDCNGTGQITDQGGGQRDCPYCTNGWITKLYVQWTDARLAELKTALGL